MKCAPEPRAPVQRASVHRASVQALDATALRAVLAELRPLLLPSRFEKAQQKDARTLQLGLRSLVGMHWLELSWLAEAPRVLAIPAPPRQGEGSTLAQQLQHGLRGLALVELRQQGWERVVELGYAGRPGEPLRRSLVLELMGRHSNLFLLDEDRRVIALARQVRESQSRLRPIGTGDPYRPPPPMAGDEPRREEAEGSWRRRVSLLPLPLKRALPAAYQGVSPALVRQLCEGLHPSHTAAALPLVERNVQELDEADWQGLHQRWCAWLEAVEAGRFRPHRGTDGGWCCWGDSEGEAGANGERPQPPPLAINTCLAAYYAERLGRREREQRRSGLAQRLGQALERERGQAAHQQALLDAVPAGVGLRETADALLSQPAPERQAIDEAQKLYRRARKLRRSVEQITPRLAGHHQRIEALEASLTYLEQADDDAAGLATLEDDLAELLDGGRSRPVDGGGRKRRRDGEPSPLELRSPGGLRLQVGRNHRQNEWISLRQARRGDLWFHAQELSGSHVVLKASERAAGEPDLQAAADLAAHFSRGRGNRRVPVVMVPTEELQRIPAAVPGTVRHRGGTVLWAEPQRALSLLSAPSLMEADEP